MTICEVCQGEIAGTAPILPAPWFDNESHFADGRPVEPTVWQVLEILWHRKGRFVSRESFMTLLYAAKPDDPPNDKIIDVYICRARDALHRSPFIIETQWNIGWRLLKGAEPQVGAVENNVPPPPPEIPRPTLLRDRYGLSQMQPGQSRVVENTPIEALLRACRTGEKRGYGRFQPGFDDEGKIRIWRLK